MTNYQEGFVAGADAERSNIVMFLKEYADKVASDIEKNATDKHLGKALALGIRALLLDLIDEINEKDIKPPVTYYEEEEER